MNTDSKVINELLTRIANLEFEIEEKEARIKKALDYCKESNVTMKSYYFIDIMNILENGEK